MQGIGGLLESAEELSSRILAHHGEDVAIGVKRERPFITNASVQKGLTTTVQLTAEGDTADDAARLLEEVVNGVQNAHTSMFEGNLKLIAERLQSLDEQRIALQQQYADLTQLAETLKDRDSVQASLVMIERGPLTTAINQQGVERLYLSQQLTRPQTRPTELIGQITAPAKPSGPKKTLMLALSAMLGIMGGVVLAVVAELVAKAKAIAVAKA